MILRKFQKGNEKLLAKNIFDKNMIILVSNYVYS